LQIIVVNDGSTDGTLREVHEFQRFNPNVNIEVLDCSKRRGKTASLNLALNKARGEVIVVSDADCFLSLNVLREALPFLADSSVGAVTGLEVLLNFKDSWVTETEILYNDAVHTIRVGESKVHSTIFFQGGFGAYKRSLLDGGFDVEADDSGTALNIVQKGVRTFLLPEVVYFTTFSSV
jgi:cellulose synthase/poly-beta-1,6-N-acetylglucosamine synthase-like glycosyltransferase